jgi:ABC-type transporter Mla subunit MlaD
MFTIDGKLKPEEVLAAFRAAAQATTDALPDALERCKTEQEKQQILAIRDACQLAYLRALAGTLKHTGPLFDQVANELKTTADEVVAKIKKVKKTVEVINLFTDVLKLAGSLSLALA